MRKVGIIGLGHMGRAVARRLHAAGHHLVLYNRTQSKADSLMQLGARLAQSPKALAAEVDVIITLLSDDSAMGSVAFGEQGFATEVEVGKIHIDMSTLSREMIEDVEEKVRESGGNMLHAPILGGPLDVFTGNATICVGGAKSNFQAALPLLESISKPVHLVGELTDGTHMKMALNIMLTHLSLGIASSLAFAERTALPKPLVHEILSKVSGTVVDKLGQKILSEEKGVSFTIKNFEKDQRYFREASLEHGLDLPTIKASHELYEKAVAAGLGEEDFTAIYKFLLGNITF